MKNAAKPDALRNQPGAVEAGPRNYALLEGEDKSRLVKKIAAKPDALRNEHSSAEAEPRNDALEGEDQSGLVTKIAAKPDALRNQPGAELGPVDKGDTPADQLAELCSLWFEERPSWEGLRLAGLWPRALRILH